MPNFRANAASVLCWGALLLGGAFGCSTPSKETKAAPPSPGSQSIQEINLLAIPVALNFDQKPGPDGFVIKVYASNRKRPKALPIEHGKIEVVMYDGIPGVTEGVSLEPRRTWTYTAAELKPFEVHNAIGTGYQLAPQWGDTPPTGNQISVLVRYTPEEGGIIRSAPSVIAVR